MLKQKAQVIKGKRIHYRLKHPLIGSQLHFDSWLILCEYVMDIAEKVAQERLAETIDALICSISDEIIETAEEYESDNCAA
jgi:hypothetical protein